jgi:hypothetical protein
MRMEDGGGMLDVAVKPDDGGFAVTHRRMGQHGERLTHQEIAEVGAKRYELGEIVARDAGQWVPDHRTGGHTRDRTKRRQSALAVDGVADDEQAANVHGYLPVSR